jgi:DnaJ-class molecular chaperone
VSVVDLPTELYVENEKLREANLKMRDKLLEIAKECSTCSGTGIVTVTHNIRGVLRKGQEDCPDCLDIRAVLR